LIEGILRTCPANDQKWKNTTGGWAKLHQNGGERSKLSVHVFLESRKVAPFYRCCTKDADRRAAAETGS